METGRLIKCYFVIVNRCPLKLVNLGIYPKSNNDRIFSSKLIANIID